MNTPQKDYYNILNIPFNADFEQIKKSYKKLALKFHPDKKNGNVEKFQEIQVAYETLSDDKKRRIYNIKRLEQMHIKSRMKNTNNVKNSHISIVINVDFKDTFTESKKDIIYPRKIKCDECDGKGAPEESFIDCTCCQGKGSIEFSRGNFNISIKSTVKCDYCNGKGRIIKEGDECQKCFGSCLVQIKQQLQIRIPKAVQNNARMIIKCKGNGDYGDLIVNYNVNYPSNIRIVKSDIIQIEKINIYDLIQIKNKVIEHPIKGKMSLNLDKPIKLNKLYYVGQFGLPVKMSNHNEYGKFLIKFELEYIENIDQDLLEIIGKYKKENEYPSYIIKEC